MKSLARDGERDAGRATRGGSSATAVSAGAEGSGVDGTAKSSATDPAVTGTAGSPDGTGTESPPDATGSAGCWLVLMTQTLRPATDSERHTIDDRTPSTASFRADDV
jgi:hypothetical protein